MVVIYSLAAALTGGWLLDRLGVPAGALVGAMLGVGIPRMLGVPTWSIPPAGRFVAYVIVGALLGQTFSRETPRLLAESFVPIISVVVAFIGLGAVLAYLLWRFGGLDPITSYLATSPGAIAQMGVLSAEAGAVAPLVLSVHLLRVTSVILITPLIVKLLKA
jgi:membrane AbrB-like protein